MESHDRNVCNFSFPRRLYFHSHQHCSRVPGVLHILTIILFEGFFIQNGFIEVKLIQSALLISAVEQNGSGTRAYSRAAQVHAHTAPCAPQWGLLCVHPIWQFAALSPKFLTLPSPTSPPHQQPQCVLCMSLLLFFRYTVALVPFLKTRFPLYCLFGIFVENQLTIYVWVKL